jgi:hypothetical protein
MIRLLKLHPVVPISGLIHFAGEFMPLGYGGSGALCFMLQEGDYLGDGRTVFPYGITRGATSDKPPQLIWRVLGYIWVDYSFAGHAPGINQLEITSEIYLFNV